MLLETLSTISWTIHFSLEQKLRARIAMFTYTMRSQRVLCSHTHGTAATGEAPLLFLFPFSSKK